jgi:hypothetical protein
MKHAKKMGRPVKPEGERKRWNVTIRGTDEFRAMIEAAAKAEGRMTPSGPKYGEQIVALCREALQKRKKLAENAGPEERLALARNLFDQAIALSSAGTSTVIKSINVGKPRGKR